jgi:rhamnosyltransferase
MKISAVIVLYNPVIEEIILNIRSYLLVEKIYVIDNSEEKNSHIQKILKEESCKIEYIANKENLGIAKALNIACQQAIIDGYEWILTMDQDSQFLNFTHFLSCAKKIIHQEKDIAIITPNHSHLTMPDTKGCDYIDKKEIVITSGNLVNLQIYQEINGYEEEFFIDMVDYDFCLKILEKNYKILFLSNHYILHELGTIYKRKNLITQKVKEKIEHPPLRIYYNTRNTLYLITKHKSVPFLKTINILFIHEITKIVLYEDQKIKKIYAKLLALKDFIIGRKGKIESL